MFFALACFFSFANLANGAPGIAWAIPTGPGTHTQKVFCDSAGDLYLAGPDVAKYSAAGEKLWSYSIGSVDFVDVTVDGQGAVYACGTATAGLLAERGYDTTLGGLRDGFVVKLNSQGVLLWSSYLGGGSLDSAAAISVDGSLNVYVAGQTDSPGWVQGGNTKTLAGGFLVKLSASGAHVWSTYVGGGITYATDVAAKPSGKVYVVGVTSSDSWIKGGYDKTLGGEYDGYLAKFSPDGQAVWSTLLGGDNIDNALGVALDGDEVYVTGRTSSSSWVSGGYDTQRWGNDDGYVVKVSGNGGHLWSTFIGGDGFESGEAITVDGLGNPHVAGTTFSTDWTAPDGSEQPPGTFYLKLSRDGALLDHRSYLATLGTGLASIAVNGEGAIFLTGATNDAQWLFSATGATPGQPLTSSFLAKIVNPIPTGSLRVTIAPGDVSATGQWRRVGTSTWRAGGFVESNVPAGVHWIEFKAIDGWRAANQRAVVTGSGQTQITGTYVRNGGTAWVDWSSYVGASGFESVVDVELDASGNCYVLGSCYARDFGNGTITPRILGSGSGAFVMKLSPTGQHVWTTVLGNNAKPTGLGVNAVGRIIVAGILSQRADWIFGGFKTDLQGVDGFVVALDPSGAAAWGTYLGLEEIPIDRNTAIVMELSGISVSANGRTVLAGFTRRAEFDDFSGYYGQITEKSYVLMIGPSGTHVWTNLEEAARRYGDIAQNSAHEIAIVADKSIRLLEADGNVRWSFPYPAANLKAVAIDEEGNIAVGGKEAEAAFVSKLSAHGQLLWSQFFGGADTDVHSLDFGPHGKIFAAGETSTQGWPSGGFDTILNDPPGQGSGIANNSKDVFLIEFSAIGSINWSTYLGGQGDELSPHLVFDGNQTLLVAGNTNTRGWFSGGFDPIYSLNFDADEPADGFVSRITLGSAENAVQASSWMLYE